MNRIAVIPPINKPDYTANTILDGLINLGSEVEFKTLANPTPFSIDKYILPEKDFIDYAQKADLIILCWGKNSTNVSVAEKIGKWEKTVFVDGSEVGKNNRYDEELQKKVANMTYEGQGSIDKNMLQKCRRYFRREKPYINGILPFPFGIECRYVPYTSDKRDIDFVCIFGQEDFPKMRKEVRLIVEEFSKKNGFVSATKKTSGFTFEDNSKTAGRDEFYKLLSRAKVGVSVGGGGYDTARFWEIYGNGCLLLTEKIDIEMPEGQELNYDRIIEFTDTEDFKKKLAEVAERLKASFSLPTDATIQKHTTKARVKYLLEKSL
jgi:hypothetical protein